MSKTAYLETTHAYEHLVDEAETRLSNAKYFFPIFIAAIVLVILLHLDFGRATVNTYLESGICWCASMCPSLAARATDCFAEKDRTIHIGFISTLPWHAPREKVERFEYLVAKRPVPRDVSAGPRAPALMMFDLSSRLEQAASARRRKREVHTNRGFSRLRGSTSFFFLKPNENAFVRSRISSEQHTCRECDIANPDFV